jgi:hypothetical protein
MIKAVAYRYRVVPCPNHPSAPAAATAPTVPTWYARSIPRDRRQLPAPTTAFPFKQPNADSRPPSVGIATTGGRRPQQPTPVKPSSNQPRPAPKKNAGPYSTGILSLRAAAPTAKCPCGRPAPARSIGIVNIAAGWMTQSSPVPQTQVDPRVSLSPCRLSRPAQKKPCSRAGLRLFQL